MRDDCFKARTAALQGHLAKAGVAVALICDEDSIYYFSGYHGYLYMDFGRPTVLVIPADGDCAIVTPSMELEMAGNMSWIGDIRGWQDGLGDEWRGPMAAVLKGAGTGRIGIEPHAMPPVVWAFVDAAIAADRIADMEPQIAEMRMIKGPEEIELARHAGKVAEAMMAAGHAAIGEGVPEYEIAIATMTAGTRKAAELLEAHYDDPYKYPNAHFLQTMASGTETTMPHHRASTKRLKRGEPVFLCFCGMTNFHRFKLGFDRMFWVGEVGHPRHQELYEIAVKSQQSALAAVRPGVPAEDVHAAYAEVIQGAGHEYPFRCGRATGYSFLERPQLVLGDKTELRPGMVLAVDGSVNEPGFFRAQVGDSVLVTETGYEPLTKYANKLVDVTVADALGPEP
jgi:Xaa-Pro aminopeptidase